MIVWVVLGSTLTSNFTLYIEHDTSKRRAQGQLLSLATKFTCIMCVYRLFIFYAVLYIQIWGGC